MDFGRLPDLHRVNFALPPDHPATAPLLTRARPAQPNPPALYVGCPIWTNKEWLGSYFPLGTKEADYLHHYARQFNSLELNTTHYRIPDAGTVRRWREAVGPGFRFCPKLPRAISHDKQLFDADALALTFTRSLLELGECLGHAFLQLPPHFGPEHQLRLERFLLDWPAAVPLAVELRHPAWFADPGRAESVFALLEALGKTLVMTDVAARRDILPLRLTTPVAFLRFNGHALHPTDYQRADAWAERLAAWYAQGLHTAYVFIHQRHVLDAPVWAQYFLARIKELTGLHVAPPFIIPQAVQGSLF